MLVNQYLRKIDEVIASRQYKDNWQSLSGHEAALVYTRDKNGLHIAVPENVDTGRSYVKIEGKVWTVRQES